MKNRKLYSLVGIFCIVTAVPVIAISCETKKQPEPNKTNQYSKIIDENKTYNKDQKEALNSLINKTIDENKNLDKKGLEKVLIEKISKWILDNFQITKQIFDVYQVLINYYPFLDDKKSQKVIVNTFKNIQAINNLETLIENPKLNLDDESIKSIKTILSEIEKESKLNKFIFKSKDNKNQTLYQLNVSKVINGKTLSQSILEFDSQSATNDKFVLTFDDREYSWKVNSENDYTNSPIAITSLKIMSDLKNTNGFDKDLKIDEMAKDISIIKNFNVLEDIDQDTDNQAKLSKYYTKEFFKNHYLIYFSARAKAYEIPQKGIWFVYKIPFSITSDGIDLTKEMTLCSEDYTGPIPDDNQLQLFIDRATGVYLSVPRKNMDTDIAKILEKYQK